jgi:hypothetical protein
MIQSFVIYSFLSLLVVGMALPSDGNHGMFAPKSLAFLGSAFFFMMYFVLRLQIKTSQVWAALFVWSAILFFGIWYAVGIDQDPQIKSGQFDQFKVFMTTLFTPFAGWYLVKEKLISYEKIMRTIIYTNCIYNIVKTSLMVFHVLGFINVWTVMHKTGLRFMSMHIIGDVGRIQTSVDIVTPFLMYFVLQSDALGIKLSNRFKWIYAISAGTSVFLSFSRFLIFAFFISIFFHICTLRYFKQVKAWIVALLLCCMGIAAIGPAKVAEVIEKRFFSSDNTASDATRTDQIDALMRACDENPIMGKGLGGYTRECIRDNELPHAYEVQWVAFLMQFGMFGILFILFPAGLIAWNFVSFPWTRPKLGYFLLFGLWLFSGFTNPFLISLTSGIIYMIFLLTGDRMKNLEGQSLTFR